MNYIEIPVNLILSLISVTNAEDGVWQYADDIPAKFLTDLADYGSITDKDIESYADELRDRDYSEQGVQEIIQLIREKLGKESS
jgi:hypothetical protein